jgi:hypothetical protein
MRTGPFTFSCLSLAPVIRSEHTAAERRWLKLVLQAIELSWQGIFLSCLYHPAKLY